MANVFAKLPLSASTDGRQIASVGTSAATADIIHTTSPGTTSTDEIYLYAYNEATASVQLSILWGSNTEPNDVSRTTIASKAGRVLVADGRILRNGLSVQAYTNVSGSIMIDGFVNRITTA